MNQEFEQLVKYRETLLVHVVQERNSNVVMVALLNLNQS
jgi:hypothetical protein